MINGRSEGKLMGGVEQLIDLATFPHEFSSGLGRSFSNSSIRVGGMDSMQAF
jgi:hypothetical protein